MVQQVLRHLYLVAIINVLIVLIKPMMEAAAFRVDLLSQVPAEVLPIPVDHIPILALRNSWHAPRDTNRRHEGIDIFAKRGTPVRSTTRGVVSRIAKSKLGGNVVWVLGPGGQRHYYAHLQQAANIRTGQRIDAGTLLGFVGNTGNAKHTSPHLHYGIYTPTGAVNPFPLLRPKSSDEHDSQ
ncbi:M23 family metallopeptidase [Noviherbaspirillum sp. Root189]|uniref:M23 family metallopeptidase n=1 Tax=Noviherbaspirillum sp. Root189 TaxID=1736487 RepID=UPI0009EBC1E9|nr:M23 family metallopeptidase [Noviherbaspirillum sp. Root189]